MGTGMGAQPTIWNWIEFGLGVFVLFYVPVLLIGERVPAVAALATATRRGSWRLLLWTLRRGAAVIYWLGTVTEDLFLTLWRGRQPTPPARPLSTLSAARQPAVMSRCFDGDDDRAADHGLSGLSAAEPALAELDPGDAWIESLDTGSRQRAVALLVRDGWGVGQIRRALVGDNGDIGREAAEARRQLGLTDEELLRTPVAGRELDEGVRFPRQPAAR